MTRKTLKISVSFLLTGMLIMTACGSKPVDTFTAVKINDCSDYFSYLYPAQNADVERQAGIVYGVNCKGIVDYKKDDKLVSGLLINTNDFGEKRIGLHLLNSDNDNVLEAYNGQTVELNGELHIQTIDPNAAGLFVDESVIKVERAF